MADVAEIAGFYSEHIGRHTGYGAWHDVTRDDVHDFANATHDWQWIHLDKERAAAGPYGGTVLHGFHTLALVPHLTTELLDLSWATFGINYRLDKVRFPTPVRTGARLRAGATLTGVRVRPRELLELALAVRVHSDTDDLAVCTLNHTCLYRVDPGAHRPRWGAAGLS